MKSTCTTLIDRVRDSSDSAAWSEFHGLYAKLVFSYARTKGLNDTDASEIQCEIMAQLPVLMKTFQIQERCSFRSWLRRLTHNKIVDFYRKRKPDPASTQALYQLHAREEAVDEAWDRAWRINHLAHCMNRIRGQIPANHFQAFQSFVIEQKPAKEVAAQTGLSVENVYQTKLRVMRRLQDEMTKIAGEDAL